MSVTAPPAEEDEENIFVFTGPLDESEFEVGRSLTACSTPRPSPTDVDWPPAPARWSDSSSPQGNVPSIFNSFIIFRAFWPLCSTK